MHLMNIPAWNNNTDEAVCIAGRRINEWIYVFVCLFCLNRIEIRFNC